VVGLPRLELGTNGLTYRTCFHKPPTVGFASLDYPFIPSIHQTNGSRPSSLYTFLLSGDLARDRHILSDLGVPRI